MSAVEKIVGRLRLYPRVTYVREGMSIRIPPQAPEGFEVGLSESNGVFRVWFEGWHEEFESESDALNCFVFGLSDACRLRVSMRGTMAYRWTMQSILDEEWVDDSETGLLFFAFWKRRSEVILQNRVIDIAPRVRAR